MNKNNKNFLLLIFAMALFGPNAHAGTITGVDNVVGSGLGNVQGLLLISNQPNNDNSPNASGENAVGYDEVVFDQIGEIDIVFSVADSGGTTEYSAIFSTFNFTADGWAGFQLELGFGTGDTFQPVATGTGLDFDTPDMDPAAESVIFSGVTHAENVISFENGSMPFGFVDAILFAVDVPDGITEFTLRQTPVRQPVTHEVPTDFLTIQEAVDAAQPGDTVSVLAGTYSERVLITRSDLILSTGAVGDPAVVDGTNVLDQPPIGGDPLVDPPVAGAGIGIHVLGTVAEPVTGVAIEGFVVHGFERGIALESTQFSRIEGTNTFDNVDKGVCCSPGTTQADGIALLGSSFNQVIGTISDDNGHDGIFVKDGSSNNDILNNITRGNGVMFLPDTDPRSQPPANGALIGCGIQIGILDNQNNTVMGNEVSGGMWGIQIGNSGDNAFNVIQFNDIHDNGRAGVGLFASAHDNIVEGNDATGNGLENIDPSLGFDLWDEGALDNSWVDNLGTTNFTPSGDVLCADISRFRARCHTDGSIQSRVNFTNSNHDGETVTIAIDGAQQALTIAGTQANALLPGFSGVHTVSLDDPAMCQADVVVNCPDGQQTLTVTLAGAGTGTVTSDPAGIDCGASCAAIYDSGLIIDLTATPDTGSVFTGYTGDADCSDGSVTMSTAVNCTASFEPEVGGQQTLMVTLAGAGTGTVTSDPAGIDCGAICAAAFDSGLIVDLMAVPDTGSVFSGYTGDADCSDGSVTMSTAVNCTASFEPEGGGGGVPCADISRFRTRCLTDGNIQTRVNLTDNNHNGETLTIAIDGVQQVLTISGSRADSLTPGFIGSHTVSLDDPPSCQVDVVVSCP